MPCHSGFPVFPVALPLAACGRAHPREVCAPQNSKQVGSLACLPGPSVLPPRQVAEPSRKRSGQQERSTGSSIFSFLNVFSPSITDHLLSWAGAREGSKKKFGSFTSRMSWEIFTSGRGSPVPLWSSRGGQGEAQHSKGRGSGWQFYIGLTQGRGSRVHCLRPTGRKGRRSSQGSGERPGACPVLVCPEFPRPHPASENGKNFEDYRQVALTEEWWRWRDENRRLLCLQNTLVVETALSLTYPPVHLPLLGHFTSEHSSLLVPEVSWPLLIRVCHPPTRGEGVGTVTLICNKPSGFLRK